jgi:hypothetical protein
MLSRARGIMDFRAATFKVVRTAPSSWTRAAAGACLAGAILAGCSSASNSSGDGGSANGSQQPSSSGTAGPSGGTLLLSCDNPIGTAAASVSHSCVDYYADQGSEDSAIQSAFSTTCTAAGGTVSRSPCPTANSPGGCLIPGSTADPYHDYSVEYFYSPTTEASVRANCSSQGDSYVAPGGETAGSTADSGLASSSSGGGSGSSGGTSSSSSGAGSSGDTCCQLAPNGTCDCVFTDGGACTARNMELTVVGSCSPSACCAVYAQSDDASRAAGATLCSCADSTYINGGGWTCGLWLSEVATGATTLTSSCP